VVQIKYYVKYVFVHETLSFKMLPGNKLAALTANTRSQFKDNLHQTNQHSRLMQFTALYILL